VTESASKHLGTTAELKPNTWINLWDLLYGAMLPSGNDAAFLLAEVFGYWSEHKTDLEHSKINKIIDLTNMHTNLFVGDFISMMNKKAEKLHLTGTNFSNPHGLQDARNVSTAKDVI
jgi:D-alanyl-D-alanine carboxypeptidase (penicillin-binding protein 5/6)